jgi:uncharacterized protein DUF4397
METSVRKLSLFIGVLALVIGALAALPMPQAARAQDSQAAGAVRFVHVYSGGGPIDIYVDGEVVNQGLAFGTATAFASLPNGDRHLQVVAAGADPSSALIDKTLTVDGGKAYNVLIGGQQDQLDARSNEVNTDQIATGQSRLRFIPGEPGSDNVDLQLGPQAAAGTQEASGGNPIGFPMNGNNATGGNMTDYQDVPAATYGIFASESGSDQPRVNVANIEVQEGVVYDVVILGQLSSNNLTFLPLMTSTTEPCTTSLGVGQGSDACIRFVHTSPDAGPVDVYIDDQVVAKEVSYGTPTEFAAVANGEHQVRVVTAGQSVDTALLDEKMSFDTGMAYQVVVFGIAAKDDNGDNDLALKQEQVNLAPVPEGQVRLRGIHAVSDVGTVSVNGPGGAQIFSDLNFSDTTDYALLKAGSYDLTIVDSDNATVLEAPGVKVEAGMIYDIFVVGLKGNNTVELLIVTTQASTLQGAQATPMVAAPATPSVTSQATPVTAAGATVVSGSQQESTPVGTAEVTPVLTPVESPTPAETPTPTPAS